MVSWTIRYDSTTITIPRLPEKVDVRKVADVTVLTIPGEEPFLLSMGIEGRSVAFSGVLYGAESSVLTQLLNAVYRVVTVSGTGIYDGTYILKEVSFTQVPPNIYQYTIQLEAGGELLNI